MTKREETGKEGENVALEFLERRGMVLRERNFRVGHKEIDLIMESEHKIHIIEVKTLSSLSVADPTEKVDQKKMNLLASAASFYVARFALTKEVQFDVVSVLKRGMDFEVEYLPDAFIPVYYR